MAHQSGAGVSLVIGIEDTYGTAPSDGFTVPFNSSDVKASRNQTTPQTITGTRNPVEPIDGNKSVGGSVVVPCDSVAMWYWLQLMFGDPATTGADPYTHTFTVPALGDQPSFALEHQFTELATAKYALYEGCKVATWSMDIGGDGELTSNIGVVGSTETLGNSAFDAAPTAQTISRLQNFHASMTEGGGAFTDATAINFTVDFGLDTSQYAIGAGGVLGSVPDGIIGVSGNITTMFKNSTLLDKAIASTESSIIITISAGASSQMVIEFNELKYALNSVPVPGPQGLQVSLPFQAYYTNHGDASAIVVALVNSVEHA